MPTKQTEQKDRMDSAFEEKIYTIILTIMSPQWKNKKQYDFRLCKCVNMESFGSADQNCVWIELYVEQIYNLLSQVELHDVQKENTCETNLNMQKMAFYITKSSLSDCLLMHKMWSMYDGQRLRVNKMPVEEVGEFPYVKW